MRPDEHALEHARGREHVRDRVRKERVAARPLVQPRGDRARVPEEQRQHNSRNQREDHVRLRDVRALEARRPHDGAIDDRGADAHEHEHDEEVDEEREPTLSREPRDALVLVDRGDHRRHDRREQHEEAPEDECVHQPRYEPLEQLALPEHDRRLVLHAARDVAPTVDGLTGEHEPSQEQGAAREQPAADREKRDEPQRAGEDRYCPRTLLSSALIAGTISCRSPTTA